MQLLIKRQRYTVISFEHAATIYGGLRDQSGEGASTWPNGKILDDNGKQTHYVSYNGKIWAGTTHVSGVQPVYNPYE